MEKLPYYLIQIAVLLFSVSVHESAHAWMAEKFGDPTGRLQGRITLNPIAHIDIMGSIIVPLILVLTGGPVFGWAKPVLVNMRNLRNPKKANIYISAAGPASNIIVAIIASMVFIFLKKTSLINPNSTGSLGGASEFIILLLIYMIFINTILAFFNLIPIPPLDGSGILEGFLRGDALNLYLQIKPYGFIIFLALFYLNIIDYLLMPIQKLVYYIIAL
jgi:Zn-dependent protease